MAFAIKKDGKLKSLYGWVLDHRGALQFRTVEEARTYAAENGVKHATFERVAEPPPPGVATDFDPFGYTERQP